MAISEREFNKLLLRVSYDQEAFIRLYEEFYSSIILHIKSVYPNVNAEDVAQEFFIKLINRKSKEYVKSPAAWVYTSCRNIVKSKYDSIKETSLDENTDNIRLLCNELDLEYKIFLNETIIKVFSALDEVSKSIFIMHYVKGYSQKELSRIFNLSVSAVKQRCLQIRKKINKILNEN